MSRFNTPQLALTSPPTTRGHGEDYIVLMFGENIYNNSLQVTIEKRNNRAQFKECVYYTLDKEEEKLLLEFLEERRQNESTV